MSTQFLTRAAASTRLLAMIVISCLAAVLLSFGITEEVAIGGLEGKVMLKENGKAIAETEVSISPTIESETEPGRRRTIKTDKNGRFLIKNLPAGDYTIYAYARAHRLDGQRVMVKEGPATVLDLQMEPSEPYLTLNASQRVFLPTEKPNFQADGFLPEDRMAIDVYRLNLTEVVKKGSISNLLDAFSRHSQSPQDPASFGSKVLTMSRPISSRDAEGIFVETVELDKLPQGFYYVRCRAGKVDRGVFVNVSTIGMITKVGRNRSMCFVTDLSTGQPIEKAAIGLAVNGGLKQIGLTGPDGRLPLERAPGDQQLVLAKKGDSVAVVDYQIYNSDNSDSSGRIFLYSDRPVYRPGDRVEFKGIARVLNGMDFTVPRAGTMECEVQDPDGNLVETMKLSISSRGTFHGSFTSNREAMPGVYTLVAEGPGGSGEMPIRLAAYRKPEFKITVTPLETFYVFGQTAKFRVKCEYYHGGPVVGAKIAAYVQRSPRWTWYAEDGEEYADESGSGEGLEDIEVISDAEGEAIISVETKKPEEVGYGSDSDYNYTVNVYAADEGDKYFEGRGSVKVTRGLFETSAETSDYVGQVGQPVDVTVKAISHKDGSPVSNQPVQIIAGEDNWSGENVTFEAMETLNATTDASGVAKVTYSPKRAGSLVFKAIAIDTMKNKIESSAYYYVEGSGVPMRPGGRLAVTLDKKTYEIGDTAKALIQTDKPGGFALLTVEADEVLHEQVINLTQSVTIVSLTIQKTYGPNAAVSVAYIREKQFSEASSSLSLALSQQKLNVTVESDATKVLPGGNITYLVTTKDQNGQPVSADISLGVVDESLYAIREDSTDPFKGFFPRRDISVQTRYSFPEIYLDGGDKGAGNVPLRTRFLDTAYWNPSAQTDALGQARITVPLPDNLTTWRATVLAATDTTAVGMATNKVVASKPLTIRLQLPQFMVVQDEQTITAIVQNDTGQPADVRVGITVKGVKLDGNTSQTVRVEPGSPKAVEWRATAETTGMAEVVATAEISGGANDGLKSTFVVKPHGRDFQETQSGMVRGDESLQMVVREGADRNTGRLVLKLSPSIASSMVQSLEGLVQFPYGCVEQTMSRFLPAILVDRTLAETGLQRPELHARIPEIAADGLARLKKMQHSDGGWGWWEFDDSDPFMTALVLDGLQRAQSAGFKVDSQMLSRGLSWAETRFSAEKVKDSLRDRVYLCYALAANGRIASAKQRFTFDFKNAAPPELAFGALTANLVGDKQRASSLVGQLKSLAKVTPQFAQWNETEHSWGAENTALALATLVKLDPSSELIPKTVRYLMTARRGEYWHSTRDTSYVLIGLTAYLKSTKELAVSPGTITVLVNGKQVRQMTVDKDSLLKPDLQIEVPMADLQVGKNDVRITHSAGGVTYYAADLKQVVPDDKLGTLVGSNDLKIVRTYYRLEARRQEDGTLRLRPSANPVDEIRSGDVVKVVLEVNSSRTREFMMIEDPVPSNCRVTERDEPFEDEQWGWWWARTVILDDRVSFFARTLPSGKSEFSYVMRAESDGSANALPTRIGNMYDPDDYASNSEASLKVNPR